MSNETPHIADKATIELTGDEIDLLVYESGPDADHDALAIAVKRIAAARVAQALREAALSVPMGPNPDPADYLREMADCFDPTPGREADRGHVAPREDFFGDHYCPNCGHHITRHPGKILCFNSEHMRCPWTPKDIEAAVRTTPEEADRG